MWIADQPILTLGLRKMHEMVPICLLSRQAGHGMIEKDKMRSGKSFLRSRSYRMVSFLPKVYFFGKDVGMVAPFFINNRLTDKQQQISWL